MATRTQTFILTCSRLGLAAALLSPACSDDTGTSGTSSSNEESGSETGDTMATGEEEDSESNSGDGDGDGDGDTDSGDGDGGPASTDTDTTDTDTTDTDTDTTDTDTTDTDTTDTDTGDGDGDQDAVCGDGVVEGDEVCDDGVNDGSYGGCNDDCLSLAAFCGDAEVNGPEACDDANDDSADGCLADCVVPESCLDILDFDDQAASGPYMIGPVSPDATFEVDCDMDTDGGGWTGFALGNTCNGDLDTTLVALEAAPTEGIDEECRPFTRDAAGAHAYQWDIEFPPGYDEFYLSDYVFKANAEAPDTTDVWTTFAQVTWDEPYDDSPATGDVSFGSPDDVGPTTSYGAEIDANIECTECEAPFPANMTPYAVGVNSTVFRIAWSENGGQDEGFFPWWSGNVYLR